MPNAFRAGLAAGLVFITAPVLANDHSMRFFCTGSGGIDRVVIPVADPERPADIGKGDFTIDWWMKAMPGENAASNVRCGAKDGWITGNILIDRDTGADADNGDYGLSLTSGRIAFGINKRDEGNTICGTTDVADGRWYHVAVTRNAGTGAVRLFVNGRLDAEGAGPTGDISYRDGRERRYEADPLLVFGAEKHDVGRAWPSYAGFLRDVRLSEGIRFAAGFAVPAGPAVADEATAALYPLSSTATGACDGAIVDLAANASPGECRFGGASEDRRGPVFVADSPFMAR